MDQTVSQFGGSSSRVNLGDRLSRYRDKQNIHTQGASACTLFYILKGGVRPRKHGFTSYREIKGALVFTESCPAPPRVTCKLLHQKDMLRFSSRLGTLRQLARTVQY